MTAKDTSHRDRVKAALSFQKPDRTPRDFAAVPEIWQKLCVHFDTADRHEVLKRLDVDCRIISYDSFCQHPDAELGDVDDNASMERSSVGGMWRKVEADGSNRDIWGAHRRRVTNPFCTFDEFCSFPLASAQSVEDLGKYKWPEPHWWNFENLRSMIDRFNQSEVYSIRYRMGSVFETAWSLYGFEKFLFDLAVNPAMPCYVMERIAEIHLQNLRTVLDKAGDQIDIVYFYDDIASQESLLISPAMYEAYLQPFHQKIIDLSGSFDKPTMMHCCGSVYRMIERFIDMGLSILNPIQPMAKDMHPEKLASEFGGRIVFHGGIDIQHFLPKATVSEVRQKTRYTSELLGRAGGYIMSGSHHIQADTALENVLAMYAL